MGFTVPSGIVFTTPNARNGEMSAGLDISGSFSRAIAQFAS